MAGPRHPESLWFVPSVALCAILCATLGGWYYRTATESRSFASMSETARGELGALNVTPRATAAEESRWVADGFRAETLIAPDGFQKGTLLAPVGPMPCRAAVDRLPPAERPAALAAFNATIAGDDEATIEALTPLADANRTNLIVADMLATSLVRAGRYADADSVITQSLDSTDLDERIIAAARAPNSTLQFDDVQFSTVIHLHQALGIARLWEANAPPPWKALKNVIGSVKQLSRTRLIGTVKNAATVSRLRIPAPGCGSDASSLTSHDLYNNLIVGYLRRPYTDTAGDRQKEFGRSSKNGPGAVSRLFQAQEEAALQNGWKNESQVWALSNAEQLLDGRRPDDARLDYNLVLLLEWWSLPEHCGAACTPSLLADLGAVEDDLIATALRRRNVAPDQQREFALGMTRMVAHSHLDRTKFASDLEALRAWLPPEKAGAIDDLLNAAQVRAMLPKWTIDPSPVSEPPFEKLRRHADAWRAAALTDFTAAAAGWAVGHSPLEKRQVLIASRQLLGTTAAPPEVQLLEKELPAGARLQVILSGSPFWWGFVAAAGALVLWLLLVWILLQVREWRTLRKSFYNVELDYKRAPGGRHR